MYSYDRSGGPRVKTAVISDGPVGRALEKHWNEIHDLEYKLKMTMHDYDDAAHFMGGPAEHEAKAMIKKIEGCLKELEHVTMHTFADLIGEEHKFVSKFKEPSTYADEMRKKVFPR
jgi:hypothetical protein